MANKLVDCICIVSTREISDDEQIAFLDSTFPKNFLKNCKDETEEIIKKSVLDDDLSTYDPSEPSLHCFAFQNFEGTIFYACRISIFQISELDSEALIPKYIVLLSRFNNFALLETLAKFLAISGLENKNPTYSKLAEYIVNGLPKLPFDSKRMEINLLRGWESFPVDNILSNSPPSIIPDTSFFFDTISSVDLAMIFAALLTEKRIVIVTEKRENLVPVMETLLSFLYPLKWCHLYNTHCTNKFIQKIKNYEDPYFLGVMRTQFLEFQESVYFRNSIILDLDLEAVLYTTGEVAFFPQKLVQKSFVWYKRSFCSFPTKGSRRNFLRINLDLIFGNRKKYYREENKDKELSTFFEEVDNSKLLENFYRSEDLPNKNLKDFDQKSRHKILLDYYEKIIEKMNKPLIIRDLRETPFYNFRHFETEWVYNDIYKKTFNEEKQKLENLNFKNESNTTINTKLTPSQRFGRQANTELNEFLNKFYHYREHPLEQENIFGSFAKNSSQNDSIIFEEGLYGSEDGSEDEDDEDIKLPDLDGLSSQFEGNFLMGDTSKRVSKGNLFGDSNDFTGGLFGDGDGLDFLGSHTERKLEVEEEVEDDDKKEDKEKSNELAHIYNEDYKNEMIQNCKLENDVLSEVKNNQILISDFDETVSEWESQRKKKDSEESSKLTNVDNLKNGEVLEEFDDRKMTSGNFDKILKKWISVTESH